MEPEIDTSPSHTLFVAPSASTVTSCVFLLLLRDLSLAIPKKIGVQSLYLSPCFNVSCFDTSTGLLIKFLLLPNPDSESAIPVTITIFPASRFVDEDASVSVAATSSIQANDCLPSIACDLAIIYSFNPNRNRSGPLILKREGR